MSREYFEVQVARFIVQGSRLKTVCFLFFFGSDESSNGILILFEKNSNFIHLKP
jgi:hypothetical protein